MSLFSMYFCSNSTLKFNVIKEKGSGEKEGQGKGDNRGDRLDNLCYVVV